ncbi:histidinol-phosphate transaminase [uncultured Maribacter sp.]|uniref:pyridoxal phosphate-dependent aminotransferase n=1 Tax=uncultured Maribacter sp. TaxID=431308 RepID=UPI002626BC16|nr:histidinol-phosphate transaminase [uncultured Maribacter sp.]
MLLDILKNRKPENVITETEYDYVRLSANENPLGPSKKVRKAMIDALDKGCRYPYEETEALAELISRKEGVSRAHIVICVGSSEGLNATGLTYGVNGGEIITADPVYDFLMTYAERFGAFINKVPLTKDMRHDLAEMKRRITSRTSLVFVCNPNNPTGDLIPKEELLDFFTSVSEKTTVFSDEAYCDYITEPDYPSMIELVKEGKNVIVSKSFSKVYALAGLRMGYLVARPDIAARIRKNIMARPNMMAIAAIKASYEDEEFYAKSLAYNMECKQYVYKILEELNLYYIPSHTNFIFFNSGIDIRELRVQMRDKGIAIGRPFLPHTNWCRISMGNMEDMIKFGEALKQVINR